MTIRHRYGLVVLFWIALGAIPLAAHHSFNAEYDFTKPVTLTGVVVKWELINPHGWITLDAKDADGTVTRWMIETGNPNALIRAGWRKDSLKAGDEVIVEGYRSKDGSNTVNGSSVRFPDGRKLLAGSSRDGSAVK
jgi:DNA/RNA endonuclease YhcR with UshA esterase domain